MTHKERFEKLKVETRRTVFEKWHVDFIKESYEMYIGVNELICWTCNAGVLGAAGTLNRFINIHNPEEFEALDALKEELEVQIEPVKKKTDQ
jgi:hypothetical protein